jgi:hypothetical protein
MLSIKKNLGKFVSILKVVESLVIETDITFNENGVYIRAIHPSNHCFVIFNIDKSFFDNYNIKKQITYTLNIQLLNKIIKKVGNDELFIKSSNDYLVLSGDKSDFELNYFVGSKDDRPIPQTQITSKWDVKSDIFFKNVEDVIEFSEVCNFGGGDCLNFQLKSHMVKGNIEVESNKVETDGCWCWYDIKYVDMIKNIKDVFDKIKVGFSKEQPLIIKSSDDNIKFMFMLACRVEDNQNE